MNKKESFFVFLMLLVAFLWGMGFIGTDIALANGLSPSAISILRFAIASGLLGIIFFKDIIKSTKKDIFNGAIAGLLLTGGFLTQSTAQIYTSIGNTAFITATNIILTPLLAFVLLKQKPKPKVYLGAVLCLVGIGLLSFSSMTVGKFNLGDGLALICAFFFAMHFIVLSKIMKKSEMSKIAFWQLFFVSVFALIYGLIFDFNSVAKMTINWKAGLAVLFLGIFPTAICYCLQSYCQKYISPSKASLVLGTESLFATIMSVILGYEDFTFYLLGGGILITIAVMIVETDFKSIIKNRKNKKNIEK